MGFIRDWDEKYSNDGGHELNYLEVGKWTLSLWFNLTNWQFGPSAEREFGGGATWPDRLHLVLGVGPFHFGAMRTWNDSSIKD